MNNNVTNSLVYNTVIDILRENTNEDNTLTIKEINCFLQDKLGITRDRHTITAYINRAIEAGNDIIKILGHKNRYYINTPMLEEYEIKFIVDCLSANKCITHKKTIELEECVNEISKVQYTYEKALRCHNEICPLMIEIRNALDSFEKIASHDIYTIPTYSEMLYQKL